MLCGHNRWNNVNLFYEKGEKKSISLQDVKTKGYLVKQGYIPKLDFISIIDEVFFDEKNK